MKCHDDTCKMRENTNWKSPSLHGWRQGAQRGLVAAHLNGVTMVMAQLNVYTSQEVVTFRFGTTIIHC